MASRCRRACRYRHPILLHIMESLETFSLPLVLGSGAGVGAGYLKNRWEMLTNWTDTSGERRLLIIRSN